MEPGRSIVGNAGILVTKVLYNKEAETKRFVIVDAAMNDLLRPSLYDAHHDILPVLKDESAPVNAVDVVGPICESGIFSERSKNGTAQTGRPTRRHERWSLWLHDVLQLQFPAQGP